MRSNVVLPLPLGPRTKSAAPGSSAKSRPANNAASPRRAARSCASSMGTPSAGTMTARIIAEGLVGPRQPGALQPAKPDPKRLGCGPAPGSGHNLIDGDLHVAGARLDRRALATQVA